MRPSNWRFLDIGFVGAYEQPFLHLTLRRENPENHIIGIDNHIKGVLESRLPNTLTADAGIMPFKNESFDGVLLLEVLEHLYCPLPTLFECWRVLRPGGEIIITTPNAWSWLNFLRCWMLGALASRVQRDVYRLYLGDADHKHFYDPLSLMNLLDDAGFRTTSIKTKNHAIPGLRRYFRVCDLIDWRFYPMNRLGAYVCLTASKANPPRIAH